jgi:high frequency lysogenization protein
LLETRHTVFETFAMNEERVIALAGLFQACALTQQLATGGRCDEGAMEAGVASVFRIDAPSVVAVFGSVADLRVGLRALVAQLDESERDMSVTKMAVTVMRLERSLTGRPDLLDKLQTGIVATQRQVEHFGQDSSQVVGRLAGLYTAILSGLRPRVMVSGNPEHLQQTPVVEKIRTNLLAAVRAAVLWRQIGGRQWQLLLYRRQCSMLARGLLTGATLDNR